MIPVGSPTESTRSVHVVTCAREDAGLEHE